MTTVLMPDLLAAAPNRSRNRRFTPTPRDRSTPFEAHVCSRGETLAWRTGLREQTPLFINDRGELVLYGTFGFKAASRKAVDQAAEIYQRWYLRDPSQIPEKVVRFL